MVSEPERVYEEDVCSFWRMQNVFVTAFTGAVTPELMRAIGDHGRAHAQQTPGPTLYVNLIAQGRAIFTSEVRQEGVALAREGIFRLGSAHVILAGGLKAAAVRAFVNTVMLIARPDRPIRLCSDVDEAGNWGSERLADGTAVWNDGELTAMLHGIVRIATQPDPAVARAAGVGDAS